MSDDTGTPAVDENGEIIKPTFSAEQEEYMNKMFEKQSEQLTSHFGRIVTKQMEEKYIPEIKKSQVNPDELNEQLSNKLFGGDVVGTIREIIKTDRNERDQLATKKEQLIEEEMEKFKDKPLFKETEKDIRQIAKAALQKGHPPGPAVELAFEKAGRTYLQNKDPEYKLGMSGQGKAPVRTKKATMPPELKKAAARDIADGIFKDEAEYLEKLPSRLKEQYNL